ncbi:MAG: PilZ domain-containing protein [Thermodesulfovibrionia bacterium]|nr:PilZ domain-containing protein [Thermodesulfovibrionia bacterium]
MKKIKLGLVVNNEEAKRIYLEATGKLEVDVKAASSFRELYNIMMNTKYSGVMIDQRTKLKSPQNEQKLIDAILDIFPSIRLNLDKKKGEMKTYYAGQRASGESLESFINKECRPFRPTTVRKDVRKDINLNVIMSRDGSFSKKDMVRTVTINFSRGGCFLYSVDEWAIAESIWLKIKELDDDTPVLGEIRWVIEWGKTLRVPGVGVMFMDLKPEQLDTIYNKYRV